MHGKSCFSQVAHLVWKKSGWWEARETEQGLWDGEIVEGCERQTTLGVDRSWGRAFWPQGLSRIWMDGRRGGDGKVANFQRWAPIISFTNTTRVRMKKHLFVIHFVVLYLMIPFLRPFPGLLQVQTLWTTRDMMKIPEIVIKTDLISSVFPLHLLTWPQWEATHSWFCISKIKTKLLSSWACCCVCTEHLLDQRVIWGKENDSRNVVT